MRFTDLPKDDGLVVRDANAWALDKLEIVGSYTAAFAKACKKAPSCQVVDGFAGPGVNRIDGLLHWGTPVRILMADPPVDRLLAMDLDEAGVDSLRERTAHDPRATVLAGDVNVELIEAMDRHLQVKAPTLAILDPEGTELAFDTIRNLSEWRQGPTPVEVLVLLATDTGFTRMLTRTGDGFEYARAKMTRLFGTDAWEPIWRDRQREGDAEGAAARALTRYVQLYADQLRSLGYRHVLDREIRQSGRHGRRGYVLMFATSHPAGDAIMDHVFDTVFPSSGQMELFKSARTSRLKR